MSPPALLTDLYELTMLDAYFAEGMTGRAIFEFFVRWLPDERNFLVAAGLAQVVDYLLNLSFSQDELAWLEQTGRFSPRFVDSLRGLAFSGDVDAMAEAPPSSQTNPSCRLRRHCERHSSSKRGSST